MTKKEQKVLEQIKLAKVEARKKLLDAVKNYDADREALERVAKIKGEQLTEEDYQEALNRYQVLVDLGLQAEWRKSEYEWKAIRKMYHNGSTMKEVYYSGDGLIIDDTIWTHEEFLTLLNFIRKYGYSSVVYINSSTSAVDTIALFIEAGGKISETVYVENSCNKYGLVIDVQELKNNEYIIDQIERREMLEVDKRNLMPSTKEREYKEVRDHANELRQMFCNKDERSE